MLPLHHAGASVMWVPVHQAADHFGVSDDTIRRRLRAGALAARQEPTASGFRWLVEIPDAPMHAPAADSNHAPAHPSTGEAAALRELVDVLKAQLAARTREVEELHILLQRQQEQPSLPQPAYAAPAQGAATPPQTRTQPLWRVLWRLIRNAQ
jgi:hypothetical protein